MNGDSEQRTTVSGAEVHRMPEVYVSTDVESDGPIPGPHSMLSFASAAFGADGVPLGTFSANLRLLPEASPDPKTAAFWDQNPAAYAATRTGLRDPAEAMADYAAWLAKLPGRPVFVAYPAGFDFTFVYWYLIRFAGHSPFSRSALDVKTFAMVLLKCGYRDATKRNMPKGWPGPAHPRRAGRRHRAGRAVPQHAGRGWHDPAGSGIVRRRPG